MKLVSLTCRMAVLAAGWSMTVAFAADPQTYSDDDFARIEKIDTHVHVHGALPAFMERTKADGFRLLTINVNYSGLPPLSQQLDDALALRRAHPGRIAFATTFDAADSRSPNWAARTQRQIETALEKGAVGVKVWKDVGMEHRDPSGRAVMIDDARFKPIFRFLERRNVVLLGHQGEPRNAWLPLQEMTIRGDRDYFAAHPQYHMFAHPEWPSYEKQIAARDRVLDRHPDLRFLGVHLASLESDVELIAKFLRRYPHASVDLAARLVHLKLQASKDREKVRQFFIMFQDRILYGSDLINGVDGIDKSDAALAAEAHEVWLDDWRFLTGDTELRSTDFEAPFRGLALPRAVVDKIYHGNARRLFPAAWPPSTGADRT